MIASISILSLVVFATGHGLKVSNTKRRQRREEERRRQYLLIQGLRSWDAQARALRARRPASLQPVPASMENIIPAISAI
jgi:hypothetical protein